MTFTIEEVAEAYDRDTDGIADNTPELTLGEKGWHRGSYNGVEYTQATLHSEDEAYDVYLTPNGDYIEAALVGEPAVLIHDVGTACLYLYREVQRAIPEKAQAEASLEPELPVEDADDDNGDS